MPTREPRTLQHNDLTLGQQVKVHFDSPVAWSGVTAGSESTNTRRITLQVRDRLNKPWSRAFLMHVWMATAANGAPSSTGNTVSFVTGTVVQEITANAAWVVLTGSDGIATFDVTITGAATQYVATCMDFGLVDYSDPIAWT